MELYAMSARIGFLSVGLVAVLSGFAAMSG